MLSDREGHDITTHFRINAAASGNWSWSSLDTDLYTRFFTGRARPPSARTATVRPTETRNALIGLDRQEVPERLLVRGKLLLQRGVRGQLMPVHNLMPEAPAPLGRDASIAMCAGSVGATTPLGPVHRRKRNVWGSYRLLFEAPTCNYICSC